MKYHIYPKNDYICYEIFEGFDSQALMLSIAELTKLEQQTANVPDKLIIIKCKVLNLYFDDIFPHAKTRENQTYSSAFKTAIIVNNEINYGIANMWLNSMNSPKATLEIFNSEQEGLEWLSTKN